MHLTVWEAEATIIATTLAGLFAQYLYWDRHRSRPEPIHSFAYTPHIHVRLGTRPSAIPAGPQLFDWEAEAE